MGAKVQNTSMHDSFFTFQNEVDNICSYIYYLSKNKCQRLRMRAFQRSNFKQWRRIRRNSLAGRMFPDSRSLERYLATHPVPWSGLLRMVFGDFKIQILFVRTFIKVKKKKNIVQSPKRFKSNGILWRFSSCQNEVLKSNPLSYEPRNSITRALQMDVSLSIHNTCTCNEISLTGKD